MAALDYHRAGWPGVVPIRGKHLPHRGYTGGEGRDTSYADVFTWAGEPESARLNVCLRLPPGVIGLDVDAYDGRNGARALAELERECGPLPPTVSSTSRTDGTGSGIRFYRVPDAGLLAWPPNVDGLTTQQPSHLDVIRRGHRYAVVWPSVHPDTGQLYRWYGRDGRVADGVPRPSELAELPPAWVARITGGQLAGERRKATSERGMFSEESERPTDQTGPIPAGGRDQELWRHACSLRAQGIPRALAVRLQRQRWEDCEQPPGDHLSLSVALAKVKAAYSHYETGRVLVEEPEAPTLEGEPDAPRRNAPLDWTAVLEGEQPEPNWYAEPLIEAGTLVALYSPAKAGKSLLLLDICAALAAGRSVLGNPAREPVRVLYLDAENTRADLAERLRGMGYAPADLARLVYVSFPSLPALDTAAGGQALLALVEEHQPAVLVLDTVSRFVQGDENEAQTYADLYRHTLVGLKRRGVAVVRLDHAGKDMTRGQRGSSAKSADVDAVWRLAPGPGDTVELVRDISRNGHGADRVRLSRLTEPLRHLPATTHYSSGGMFTAEAGPPPHLLGLVKALDDAGVPSSHGRDRTRAALPAAWRVRHEVLSEAIAWRRDRDEADAEGPFGTPSGEGDR